jgi:hypothetical protein
MENVPAARALPTNKYGNAGANAACLSAPFPLEWQVFPKKTMRSYSPWMNMSKEKKLQIRNSTAEFLVFTRQAGEDGIEVRVAEETVWLTQKLISELFDKGRSTITEHLKNIFETGELDENAVCRDFRHTAGDGKDYTTRFRQVMDYLTFLTWRGAGEESSLLSVADGLSGTPMSSAEIEQELYGQPQTR